MDKSKIVILSMTPRPVDIMAAACKNSICETPVIELYNEIQENWDANLERIIRVVGMGHETVLEHVAVNLAFEDVSVVVEQIVIGFRLASFTVKSRRYVNFAKQGWLGSDPIFQQWFDFYAKLISEDVPKEDARYVLPYSFRSNFYCTMNLREVFHMLNHFHNCGEINTLPEVVQLKQALMNQLIGAFEDLVPTMMKDKPYPYASSYQTFGLLQKGCDFGKPSTPMIAPITKDAETAIVNDYLWGMHNQVSAPKERIDLLEHIVKNHPRSLEAAYVRIEVPYISLANLTHITRHRMLSLSIPPITSINKKAYILPKSFSAKQKGMFVAMHTDWLKNIGDSKSPYLLLACNITPISITCNYRELFHIYRLRMCNRAQWEIRSIITQVYNRLANREPALHRLAGSACMIGKCDQGTQSCKKGKINVAN